MDVRFAEQHKISRGGRILVTTKLCEPMVKSRTGHQFDSTQTREYRHVLEYNNLQDPNLKDYFFKPQMKERLITNQFVTPDLKVICNTREYNAYRLFLEDEVAKIRRGKEEQLREQEWKKKFGYTKKIGKYSIIDRERDERKKQFLSQEEKKIERKRYVVEVAEMQRNLKKRLELEQRHLQRIKTELNNNSKAEMSKLKLLLREQKLAMARRDSNNWQIEVQHQLKRAEQSAAKRNEYLRSMAEFESRWIEKHENPCQSEGESDKRKGILKEREDEMKRKEKAILVQEIDSRKFASIKEQAPKEKPAKKSNLWVHLLEEQADFRKREWGEVRRYNLEGWEAVKRQWDQWKVQLRLRREAWRQEHEKLLQNLLRDSSTPSLNTMMAAYKKKKEDEKEPRKEYLKVPFHGSTSTDIAENKTGYHSLP